MNNPIYLILCLFLATGIKTFASEKYRVVILTDMTHDDGNSLIRYLYYSHQFETEAIIITPQLPDFNFNDKSPWEKGQSIMNAYQQEYNQLSKHHNDYPTPEQYWMLPNQTILMETNSISTGLFIMKQEITKVILISKILHR